MQHKLFLLGLALCITLSGLSNQILGKDSTQHCFDKVLQQHLKIIQHIEKTNPPLLIVFSATLGMGKTYVSKAIEHNMHAIRLSSDEARHLLKANNLSIKLVDDYLDYCLEKLLKISQNRTIILDRSCDRTYNRYVSFSTKHTIPIFLIRIVVPKHLVEKRLISRDKSAKWGLKRLKTAWQDYERFGQEHTFNYILDNSYEGGHNIALLIEAIYRIRSNSYENK